MRKILSLLLILFILSCAYLQSSVAEEFSKVEKVFEKTYSDIDKKDYRIFYENAAFTINNNKMYLVNQWRGSRAAYLYGCDNNGQLKSYLNMDYKRNGELGLKLKVTYEAPISGLEASAKVYEVGNSIMADMEKYAKEDTVRIVSRVSLRENPTSKSKRIKFLKGGELYKLITKEKKWVQVSSLVEPSVQGWVYHSYVRQR
ncbi:hypothetical protein ACFL5G_02715 [Candidatus Margulisiibacteriota bacterium]